MGQRKKEQSNQIGYYTVELLKHGRRKLKVKYLDVIDGTPMLDIKPVLKAIQSKGKKKQLI